MPPATALADRRISALALVRLLGPLPPGPAYVGVADGVRRAILAGSLPLSTRLPSERDLARALGVSRTTTAAAYERLRGQGFLSTRRGAGSISTIPSGPRRPSSAVSLSPVDGPDDAVIDLTIAAPTAPAQLHAAASRALEALPRYLGTTGYTLLGLVELRQALADRYTRRGTPTAPDEILVTSGAQQAISLVLSTTVARGERVVVEHPTYPHAIGAVRAVGGRPVPVPVGRDGLDLDLLESTVRQTSPRVVQLIPDHHNPTGTSIPDEDRSRVRDLAARHGLLVVGDETLTDLVLDGGPPASFTGPRTLPGVVVIGSTSKSFWGGLRIGWVRGHRDLVAHLAGARGSADISSPLLEQLVAVELLRSEADLAAERRRRLREQRDALLRAVAQQLPWLVPVPTGGLSAWAELGAPVSSTLSNLALQHDVRVVPGPVFGLDGSFEDRLRLTFTQPAEILVEGVARLARAWGRLDHERSPAEAGRPRSAPGPVV